MNSTYFSEIEPIFMAFFFHHHLIHGADLIEKKTWRNPLKLCYLQQIVMELMHTFFPLLILFIIRLSFIFRNETNEFDFNLLYIGTREYYDLCEFDVLVTFIWMYGLSHFAYMWDQCAYVWFYVVLFIANSWKRQPATINELKWKEIKLKKNIWKRIMPMKSVQYICFY